MNKLGKTIWVVSISAAISACGNLPEKSDSQEYIDNTSIRDLSSLREEVKKDVESATESNKYNLPDLAKAEEAWKVTPSSSWLKVEKAWKSLEASIEEINNSTIVDIEFKNRWDDFSYLVKTNLWKEYKDFIISGKIHSSENITAQLTLWKAYHRLKSLSDSFNDKTIEQFLVAINAEMRATENAYFWTYLAYGETKDTILNIEEVVEENEFERTTTTTKTFFDWYSSKYYGFNAKVLVNDSNLLTARVWWYEEWDKSGAGYGLGWEHRWSYYNTELGVEGNDRWDYTATAWVSVDVSDNTRVGVGLTHDKNNYFEDTSWEISITYFFDEINRNDKFTMPGLKSNINTGFVENKFRRWPQGKVRTDTTTTTEVLKANQKPSFTYNGETYKDNFSIYETLVKWQEYNPTIDYGDDRDSKDSLVFKQEWELDTNKTGEQIVVYRVTDTDGLEIKFVVIYNVIEKNTEIVSSFVHGKITQNTIQLLLNAQDSDNIVKYEIFRDWELIKSGDNSGTELKLDFTDNVEPGEYTYKSVVYWINPETEQLEKDEKTLKLVTAPEKPKDTETIEAPEVPKPVIESITGNKKLKPWQELDLQINMETPWEYTYELLWRYANLLNVDENGRITWLLWQAHHHIQIIVRNKNWEKALAEVWVTVSSGETIENPIANLGMYLDNNSVLEGQPTFTVVGQLILDNLPPEASYYYVIPAWYPFSVDGSDRIIVAAPIDFESQSFYNVPVEVHITLNGKEFVHTKYFPINIIDIPAPEAPSISTQVNWSDVTVVADSNWATLYKYYIDGVLIWEWTNTYTITWLTPGTYTVWVRAASSEWDSPMTTETVQVNAEEAELPTISNVNVVALNAPINEGFDCYGDQCWINAWNYDIEFTVTGENIASITINWVAFNWNSATINLDIPFTIEDPTPVEIKTFNEEGQEGESKTIMMVWA